MLSYFLFNVLWLAEIYYANPTYSIIYYGNIIFDLHPLLQEHN